MAESPDISTDERPHRRLAADAGRPARVRARALATLFAAASALVLTGCMAGAPAYAELEREAVAADKLPESLPDYALSEADPGTARFVGEHEGTSLWLMRGDTDTRICLLAYAEAPAWVLACGGQDRLDLGGLAGTFTVVPDRAPDPDGATRVSANVYAFG